MRQRIKFLALLIATILALTFMALPIFAQTQLTEQSKVVIDGIGPIRVGMTVAEAETAAKLQLVKKGGWDGQGGCFYLWPKSGPQNVGFMVISNRQDTHIVRTQDRIARVDIYKGSAISTLISSRTE